VDVSGLIGKSVVCFCYPNPCRGDLLIAKANFRVVVFGGRNFRDIRLLHDVLDAVHGRRKITCIIEGKRREPPAREWAEDRGV